MPIQICKVTGDGVIQRTGVEGFYKGTGETTESTPGSPYWTQVVDWESEGQSDGTLEKWLAWAVENDANIGCGLSFTVEPFEGNINSVIEYIKVIFLGFGGQSGGSYVAPSGDGNNFNIGVYYDGIEYTQPVTFIGKTDSDEDAVFTAIFSTKQDGTPWTPSDFPIEIMFSYGRYWTTADKSYTINDNAQNITFYMRLEIVYDEDLNSSASSLLLM